MTERYAEQQVALLPVGRVWSLRPDSTLQRLIGAIAAPFEELDRRAQELLDELDPRTTVQLLPEWERVYGLPDKCTPELGTLQERRARLVSKIQLRPEMTLAFYQQLAEMLGYTGVVIDDCTTSEDFQPARCGVARCGTRLRGPKIRFNFRVTVPDARVTYFRAGASRCGDSLGKIDRADDLECVLREAKPAHMYLIFSYEGVARCRTSGRSARLTVLTS